MREVLDINRGSELCLAMLDRAPWCNKYWGSPLWYCLYQYRCIYSLSDSYEQLSVTVCPSVLMTLVLLFGSILSTAVTAVTSANIKHNLNSLFLMLNILTIMLLCICFEKANQLNTIRFLWVFKAVAKWSEVIINGPPDAIMKSSSMYLFMVNMIRSVVCSCSLCSDCVLLMLSVVQLSRHSGTSWSLWNQWRLCTVVICLWKLHKIMM